MPRTVIKFPCTVASLHSALSGLPGHRIVDVEQVAAESDAVAVMRDLTGIDIPDLPAFQLTLERIMNK